MTSLFDGFRLGPEPITKSTPYQLRGLVLDYLAHQGYTGTAAAFARDSTVRHVDADGDETMEPPELSAEELAAIEHRKEIYHHIQCGRIDDATALLNLHFPAVLGSSTRAQPPPQSRRISDAIIYASPTSTDPQHLALNLRIQNFIESSRTRPLPFPPPDDTDTDSDNEEDPLALAHPDYHNILPTELAVTPTINVIAAQNLLNKAKKLMALAQTLPNPSDRAVYVRELKNVGGLLAYQVPENSSIRKYLAQGRRDAVADQIHRAILERAQVCSASSLELLVRYTANLWYFAHKMDVKPRPGAILPPTTVPPLLETVPMFDLGVFIDHKA